MSTLADMVLSAVDTRWTTLAAVRRTVHSAEARQGLKMLGSDDAQIRRKLAEHVQAGRIEVLGVGARQMWKVKQ